MNTTKKESLLEINQLQFRWPKMPNDCLLIDHFVLQKQETIFLYGPSGCGKSTFLSLVAGVLTAYQGSIQLLGHEWKLLSSAQRDQLRANHVGYIFQQFNLLPYLCVLDNVLLPCGFSAHRSKQAGKATQEAQILLERMGIASSDWHRRASDLSVGQQQRVAAARALIGQPNLIVADEPTSALDEALRNTFIKLLIEACADAKSALLFVSHDARLASHFHKQIDLTLINQAFVKT